MNGKVKSCLVIIVFLLLAPLVAGSVDSQAASKVKLSKTKITFASPTAKAQTITIKNIKKSNIKSVKITNYPKTWVSVKKKGKNQLVVTPKLSSDSSIGGIDLIVEFMKPIKGDYRAYLSVSKVKVNGKSQIPVKTAADFLKMSGNCVNHRWTYYLTNDIDLTGKGYWNDRSTGNNIVFDGKGHKIISDGPAFGSFFGKMKNVVFECNYDMAVKGSVQYDCTCDGAFNIFHYDKMQVHGKDQYQL